MIIQLEDAKRTIASLEEAVKELGSALRIDDLRNEIVGLEEKTSAPDFWSDSDNSGKILARIKSVKGRISRYEGLYSRLEDVSVLCEMGIEENDESVVEEVLSEIKALTAEEGKQRIEVLLSGEYDHNNTILFPSAESGRVMSPRIQQYSQGCPQGVPSDIGVKSVRDSASAGVRYSRVEKDSTDIAPSG